MNMIPDDNLESDRKADISDEELSDNGRQSIKVGHAPLKELKE